MDHDKPVRILIVDNDTQLTSRLLSILAQIPCEVMVQEERQAEQEVIIHQIPIVQKGEVYMRNASVRSQRLLTAAVMVALASVPAQAGTFAITRSRIPDEMPELLRLSGSSSGKSKRRIHKRGLKYLPLDRMSARCRSPHYLQKMKKTSGVRWR